MPLQNFPGVYSTVTNQSQTVATTSPFVVGLVGVASNGPFNTPIQITSFEDAQTSLGASIPGSYLMNAIQLVSQFSDAIYVTRVGSQYTNIDPNGGSGTISGNVVHTTKAALFTVGDYVRISQPGLPSTVNARIQAIDPVNYNLTLVNSGVQAVPLAATYTAATIDQSAVVNAANEAETFLVSPTWSTPITAAGTLSGTKGAFSATVTGSLASILPGSTLLITQQGFNNTTEIMVKYTTPAVPGQAATIYFEPVSRTDIGYQAISLQDSYTNATIQTLTGYQNSLHVIAVNNGTWANSTSPSTGLVAKVIPGSTPNTKAIQLYVNGSLVETIDNLSANPSSPNFYETYINGNDSYIAVKVVSYGTFNDLANTRAPWNTTTYPTVNVAGFYNGFNGETAANTDYIGTVSPTTGVASGLKVFDNLQAGLGLRVVAVPGITDVSVAQELQRVAQAINAFAPFDTPDNIPLSQAIDFHNGAGLYSGQGYINDWHFGYFFNWFQITDATTGLQVFIPPSCGYLRCAAAVSKLFYAAAGDINGLIPEASALRFPRLKDSDLQRTINNGNALNCIISYNGNIELFGDLTSARSTSTLQEIHAVHCVNLSISALSAICRKYIFGPIDSLTLAAITIDGTQYLKALQANGAIENFAFECDSGNNTAADRNARQANATYWIIPEHALYKVNLAANVLASGASLTNLTVTPINQ